MSPPPYNCTALLYIFQYLNLRDLLQTRRVCTTWRDVVDNQFLCRTVRTKNCQIRSIEGLADILQKYRTMNLELWGTCLLSDPREMSLIPRSFSNQKIDFLKRIELYRIPTVIVEKLARMNPELQVMNALYIQSNSISLNSFAKCAKLQKLTLQFDEPSGCILDDLVLTVFRELKYLRHLSLTHFNNLHRFIDVIDCLRNLQSLELGHFIDIPNRFASDILPKLVELEKLRLEWILNDYLTLEIMQKIKRMPKLEQLELINVHFSYEFGRALSACTNIKKLMIIPDGSTPNNMLLSGALALRNTLSHFVWGITFGQLTRFNASLGIMLTNDLFVEPLQFHRKQRKQGAQDVRHIVYKVLSFSALKHILQAFFPTTRVKLIKVPFATTYQRTLEELLQD